MNFQNTLSFAQDLDQKDPLKDIRDLFLIPNRDDQPEQSVIYLCGNSLGLQPKAVREYINAEMQRWEDLAVEGHFKGKPRWYDYRKESKPTLANIVGAQVSEVVPMNNLTSNLHFMMISFYQPKGKRVKILMEAGAFPSDQYAMESHIRLHGLDQSDIVEIAPRDGEHTLRTEDILSTIKTLGDELALVLFGGINYYTGQAFDMESITKAGHEVGAMVGFDLAHAVGNLDLALHDWGVDFAVWCSYKYLNSSPGGVGGAYVHERHHSTDRIRLAGWWGHNEEERFEMKKGFKAIQSADGWQVANEGILLSAAHRGALVVFDKVFEGGKGMEVLREKSRLLTGYLEYIIESELSDRIEIITPKAHEERGCQLSLVFKDNGRESFEKLMANGVVADWRSPNVIRLAPTPLYNTFEEVYKVGQILLSI